LSPNLDEAVDPSYYGCDFDEQIRGSFLWVRRLIAHRVTL